MGVTWTTVLRCFHGPPCQVLSTVGTCAWSRCSWPEDHAGTQTAGPHLARGGWALARNFRQGHTVATCLCHPEGLHPRGGTRGHDSGVHPRGRFRDHRKCVTATHIWCTLPPVKLLSIQEAARRLGISPSGVLSAIRRGTLLATNLAPEGYSRATWGITESALEEYRRSHLGKRGRPRRKVRNEGTHPEER